jgi:hypothetical protein
MRAPARERFAVEVLDWSEFLAVFDWRQGEHVSLIGPTGTGKTTAAVQLLPRRAFVAAIGTKPKDQTLDQLRRDGYRVLPELPHEGKPPRVIVWPRSVTLNREAKKAQARTIRNALDQAYSAGSWTVFVDELSYVSRTLRLAPELVDIWQQGRANNVSLIGCTQRPRWVPLDAYSAASHLFLWRTNDRQDISRLAGLNGADSAAVQSIVPQLERHEVLYVNTRTGALCITVAPKLN